MRFLNLFEFIFGKLKRRNRKINKSCDNLIPQIDGAINEACDNLISQIDGAINEAKNIFTNALDTINSIEENEWKRRNGNLLSESEISALKKYKKASHFNILLAKQSELINTAKMLPQKIAEHNERVANMKIQKAYSIIGDVEGQKLDQQQMHCIITKSHNHLVIAGAGTGKTTTIIGKIKYLLKTGECAPMDILVLSFTNASAYEMRQRINAETCQNIEVSTFHKLGLNIITKVNGIVPKITQINLRKFIKEQIILNMKSDKYLKLLNTYAVFDRINEKSEFEFGTQKEYDEYLKLNPPTTINNERVKSYGEMDIANFLLQNDVQYIYEYPYEIDTRTSERKQYQPDFYLPDYGIYIEYFSINRQGDVPSYFHRDNELSPSDTYRASMQWKRSLHNVNGTIMIECYAYEKFEDTLLENLKNKLISASVILNPKTPQELWTQISNNDNSVLDGIIELFETLINLIKSNNYTLEFVKQLNSTSNNSKGNEVLLSLLEPIYSSYRNYLSVNNEIDFNDMINIAADYIKQGRYISPYKYVIVDEYQDISKSRYKLLSSIRKTKDYDLFCVGDDWQSIYRFAGSDINYILNFSNYWGTTIISKIETTYRFSQKLVDISSSFIMQNPVQIKKSIKGKNDFAGFPFGEINGYTDKYAIEFMNKKLDDIPNGSKVLFIGRYSSDIKILSESGLFTCKHNNISGFIDVESQLHPNLLMTYLTAHRSKGLQADYVFIINNKSSKMGFPSKMQDSTILNLLLDNNEQYPYAEERRLFYVALTRAKKKAFIVTVKNKESEFALELKNRYEKELIQERFECPICGGRLIKKIGPYGEFFGCSNYHLKGCTYKRKIQKSK